MSSADVEQAEPADELREGLLAQLVEELGDSVVGSEIRQNDMWVRVHRDAWHRAAEVCRQRLGCDYFCFLSGLDWMPAPKTGGDAEAVATDAEAVATDEGEESETPADATPVEPVSGEGRFATGYAGGDTRFQVFARLYSTRGHYGITLKADLDDIPRVDSIADLYAGANWHEREAWEMYGFEFVGHPDLRHLYLPSEFEGFPLRKDFPLLSREVKPWPGLVDVEPMPQEEGDEAAAGDEEGEG